MSASGPSREPYSGAQAKEQVSESNYSHIQSLIKVLLWVSYITYGAKQTMYHVK